MISRKVLVFASLMALFFPSILLPSPVKVACIGNSITAGGYSWLNGTTYPELLQELLGAGFQVLNGGVPGTTLLRNGDNPYWTDGLLPQVFAQNPDIVTVKLGTNDGKPWNWAYKDEFARDLTTFIDTLKTLPSNPRIYVVLPAPIFPPSCCSIDRNAVNLEVVPRLRLAATELGIPIIDCHAPLWPFPQYFPDGVHPDAAGADTIAHIIFRAITEPGNKVELPTGPALDDLLLSPVQNGTITVSLTGRTISRVDLVNLSGSIILSVSGRFQSKLALKTGPLSSGIYLIHATTLENGAFFRKVAVIQ